MERAEEAGAGLGVCLFVDGGDVALARPFGYADGGGYGFDGVFVLHEELGYGHLAVREAVSGLKHCGALDFRALFAG